MIDALLAHALKALAWCAGLPSHRLRRAMASFAARREIRTQSKRARIVACNLRLTGQPAAWQGPVLEHTALTLMESLRIWTRPSRRNLAQIVEAQGLDALADAEARGAVIVVAPHQGNWELLLQWLAARRSFAVLYTRGESAAMDRFLRLVRERHGVKAVPADPHGIKPLLRLLQQGGSIGITPDQRPESGALWSPFFGVPAPTMTLIHRLQERSGATLVLAAAERRDDDRFVVRIAPMTAEVTSGPMQHRVDAMNLAIEAFVREAPLQYQWSYKRYRSPDDPDRNPYWPECY